MTSFPEPSVPGYIAPPVDAVGGYIGVPLVMDLRDDDRTDDERSLANLLDAERVLMLTTVEGAAMTSRPLTLAEVDGSTLRFLVDVDASWVAAVQSGASANASVADDKRGRWVSICGRTKLVADRDEVDRLWSSAADPFFPAGRQGAAVLVLEAFSAEWWEAGGTVRRLANLVKAIVANEVDNAKHGFLDLGDSAATSDDEGASTGN